MTPAQPIARGPLFDAEPQGGVRPARVGGWECAVEFDGEAGEAARARSHVGIADLAHLPKLRVVGRAVGGRVAELFPRDRADQPVCTEPGRAWLAPGSSARGPAPVLWARLGDEELVAIALGDGALPDLPLGNQGIHAVDVTGHIAAFELVGPRSQDVLRQLTSFDVLEQSFAPGSCAQTGVARVPATLIRPPSAALARVQIWVGREYGRYVWDALVETARSLGGGPTGWLAWRSALDSRGGLASA